MNNKTKIILTALGLGAIIIPAILLVVFSSNKGSATQSNLPTGTRQIDKSAIQNEVQPPVQVAPSTPSPLPVSPVPTPSPIVKTTPSPNLQSTPSGVH